MITTICFVFIVSTASGGRRSRHKTMLLSHAETTPRLASRPQQTSFKRSIAVPSAATDELGLAEAMPETARDTGDVVSGSSSNSGSLVADKWSQAMEDLKNQEHVHKRMLVHEGRASVEVWKGSLSPLAESIRKMIESDGSTGYIEEEDWYQFHGWGGDEKQSQLQGVRLRIRVESDQFEQTMKDIRKTAGEEASIVDWHTSSRDVTDEYVDSSSRANVVDASRKSLQVLLQKAQTVKDIFTIEQELTRLTERYESHKQRAAALAKSASLSTLYLDLKEKSKRSPYQPPSALNRFTPLKSAKQALEEITELLAEAGNNMVYIVVFAVPIIILGVLVLLVFSSLCFPMFQKTQLYRDVFGDQQGRNGASNPYRKNLSSNESGTV